MATKSIKKLSISVLVVVMYLFVCVGYAAISDSLSLTGNVNASAPELPDVYITSVTPNTDAGVTVKGTDGTVFFAGVNGSGTATFTINVINISDKIYIFERVIDGFETGIDGVYSGTDITYKLSGISSLDEIQPNNGTLSFNISITVPKGVSAENYILKFNFIEKTGTEILPGNDEYDIIFQYNNGQLDKTVKVRANDFVPRPDTPLRNGYTFIGWYTDPSYTSAWNFEIDRVTGHMTLYAGWEKMLQTEYLVTLRPNNGESSRTIIVLANSLIPPQPSPTMEGYTFIGWYIDEACTNPWNFDTNKVTANTTLYGGWEVFAPPVPPDCNITFKPNNGDADTTIIVLTGEFIPRPPTPIRNGYIFIGWYTDEACTVAWNFEVNKVENHMILYGGWDMEFVVESKEYTITFEPNNGSASTVVNVEEKTLIPRPIPPTRSEYTFIGWYTDADCTSGWNFDTDYPISNMTLYAGWEKNEPPSQGEQMHNDFMGLVEALLSDSSNCLNANDLIFDAVMESLTSKKRPKEDAPILHCSVNSVSGGTMSSIATFANSKLTSNLHFIFEVDPDPAYQNTRLRLYMYYGDDCESASNGENIMVYKQILSRGTDGVWFADGTYIGVATVGEYFGGGNSGKDVKTINPYTWKSSVTTAE